MKNAMRLIAMPAASFCAALLLFAGCSRPAAKPAARPQPPPATVIREAHKAPPIPAPAPVEPPAVRKPAELRLTLGRVLLITRGGSEDARPILAAASRTLDDMGQLLKLSPSNATVTVRLPETRQGKTDETMRLARRETARVEIMTRFPDAPPWAREGLACYFENGAPYDRPNAAALKLIQDEAEDGAEGALSELASAPADKPLDPKSIARAWALTHFLVTQTEEGPAALRKYLDQARAGKRAAEAFSAAFGVAPDELEPAWRLHLARLEALAKDGK